MIRINLLPVQETERARARRREMRRVGLALVLVLVGSVGARIAQGGRTTSLEARIREQERAIAALDSRVREVAALEETLEALEAKLTVIAGLRRNRLGPIGVLRDLAEAVPDRVWLTDFSEAGGATTLGGHAVDDQILAEFLRKLATSPNFTSVDLVESARDPTGERKLRKFTVKVQIDYAAERRAVTDGPPLP